MTLTARLSAFRHRFFPAAEPSGKLVLGLHGRGDSKEGYFDFPAVLGVPRLNYLFVDAPDAWGDGFSWYDLAPNQAPGVLRSRQLLFAAIDELQAQGWQTRDIVLFGFSQGCLMSLDVGLRYPQPLGGVCGISGYLFAPDAVENEMTPHAKDMPWLMTHGTRDDILPIGPSRGHAEVLQAAGLPLVWHEFVKAHTIEPRRELPLLRTWFAERATT